MHDLISLAVLYISQSLQLQQYELCITWKVDHTPPIALLELATAMATSSLCRIYHQAMTKNRPRLSLCLRLGGHGLLNRPLETRGALRCSFRRECISMATLVCAHGTAILTNHGPSELVEERIFYALQVRTRTI